MRDARIFCLSGQTTGVMTMWMTGYIKAVKCGLRDQHGFKPSGGTKKDPIFKIVPDGLYPMSIEGKTDYVKIKSGSISCCNWKNPN